MRRMGGSNLQNVTATYQRNTFGQPTHYSAESAPLSVSVLVCSIPRSSYV